MRNSIGSIARNPYASIALLAVLWPAAHAVTSSPAATEGQAVAGQRPISAGGGSVVGTVKFLDTPPAPERLKVDRDNNICGLRKFSEDLIVAPQTKGLKNVVLTVVGIPAGSSAPPRQAPALQQNKCVYEPHVQAAVVGQKLEVKNVDDLLHNIHAYAANQDTLFNVAQPIRNQVSAMALQREGVTTVKCDVHSWMLAYVVVAPHPYTAVTDANGSFRIDGVPPGSYKLRAWHEALGTLDKDLIVAHGREATVNFDVGK